MRRAGSIVVGFVLLLVSGASAQVPAPFAGSTPAITQLPIPSGTLVSSSDGLSRVIYNAGSYDAEVAGVASGYVDLGTRHDVSIAPPAAAECRMTAGPGRLAALCSDPTPPYAQRVFVGSLDGAGWTQVHLGESAGGPTAPLLTIAGVGRSWVWLTAEPYHGLYWIFARPNAPAVRVTESRADTSREALDLDTPTLGQPMCAPIQRPRLSLGDYGEQLNQRFQYVAPWAIENDDNTLNLYHCHSREQTTLCRSGDDSTVPNRFCTNEELGPTMVTWSKQTHGYIRDLRTGHTTVVSIPGAQYVQLEIVGHHVVATTGLGVAGIVHLG